MPVYMAIETLPQQPRRYQGGGSDAARKSAEIAERTLTDYERPWLFVESVKIERRTLPPDPNSWFISFEFRNIGRMPAIIEECVIKFEDISILPHLPDYENSIHISCRRIIAPNVLVQTTNAGPSPKKAVKDEKIINFVAFGRITYKDLNGRVHHTGFAVEVSPHIAASSPCRNEAYEYYD